MTDDCDNNPNWIPACVAFQQLRKRYEAAEIYANSEVCCNAAADTLIRRLRSGQLPSRAVGFTTYDDLAPDDEPPFPNRDNDGMYIVPQSFWGFLANSSNLNREDDWVAGDFEYSVEDTYVSHGGSVFGLLLDSSKLPTGPPEIAHASNIADSQSAETKAGGRPPAKWWADFAEELAVYIHEQGPPEGTGHEGQSELMDAIFARMTERGKPEPGRPTVQPVINAVLRRLRSAGK